MTSVLSPAPLTWFSSLHPSPTQLPCAAASTSGPAWALATLRRCSAAALAVVRALSAAPRLPVGVGLGQGPGCGSRELGWWKGAKQVVFGCSGLDLVLQQPVSCCISFVTKRVCGGH